MGRRGQGRLLDRALRPAPSQRGAEGARPGAAADAASEASLLDQPLARAVVCHAASFDPLRPPRLVLAAGAPAPEFAVLRRRGGAHWERELERACNRPFRSEEVVLPAGAGVGGATGRGGAVRAQRACSFVLLLLMGVQQARNMNNTGQYRVGQRACASKPTEAVAWLKVHTSRVHVCLRVFVRVR